MHLEQSMARTDRSEVCSRARMGDLQPIKFVDDSEALDGLVAKLARCRAVAVDCEANSFHAYHERLCLLQLSADGEDFVVDPLAPGLSLAPLVPIFADPAIVKVLHSAEFDVMLLKRAQPMEIHGLFDTRVAASSLGLPNVGLAPLMEEHFGVETDKRFQRSDWGKRPLDEAQLEYARLDTHWLLRLAGLIRKMLHEADPLHIQEVAAECRRLEALEPLPKEDPATADLKIKGLGNLPTSAQAVGQRLNLWRHTIASETDRPVYKILSNAHLLALAEAAPTTVEALRRSKAVPARIASRYGEDLVAAVVAKGGAPARPPRSRATRERGPTIDRERYEALREWRRDAAAERNTDASLVLSRVAMESLARLPDLPRTTEDLARTGLIECWRLQHYGEGILEALTGR